MSPTSGADMEEVERGVHVPAHDRPLVRLTGITKRFGLLLANDAVTFDIAAGRVVGLLGENGAGKTTTMNALAGLYLPDAGGVEIDGKPLRLGSPRHSVAAGVGMVHQQFKLVPTLTGHENIMLAIGGGVRLPRRADSRLERLMHDLGFDIDLGLQAWQLGLASRQQLEILRALAVGARILVLDEPTSVLPPVEAEKLFVILRRVAASGRSVVLISHKLTEILGIADDVIVMRAGRVVHSGAGHALQAAELARLIVGDRVIRTGARAEQRSGAPVLRVEDLMVLGDRGAPAVRNVSFEVGQGELVALAGVTGNGQTELMEAIGGLRRIAGGRVIIPNEGRGRGFAYIPAQHLGVALAPSLSLAENAILGHHRGHCFGRWLSAATVAARAKEVLAAFNVSGDPASPARRLSGGNLQRLVLGRELYADPSLIVADYPTRGLDVASAAQIRHVLVERAAGGAAVLLSSEEIEESLEIANRILVMHRGEIIAERLASSLTVAELGQLMTMGRG